MFLAFLIGSIALQAWAWRSLVKRMRADALTRLQGLGRYAGWAFLPVLVFVGLFVAMVGLEEWRRVALIPERAPLLALPVVGIASIGWIAFALRCAFLRKHKIGVAS